MGLIDNIRSFFSGSNKQTDSYQIQKNEEYEKSILVDVIIDLADRIKRVNSFDRSVWNISNASKYELKRKSIDELKSLESNLKKRLSELNIQRQTGNSQREFLESSKWTGRKPEGISDHDFDRFQRDDGR